VFTLQSRDLCAAIAILSALINCVLKVVLAIAVILQLGVTTLAAILTLGLALVSFDC